MVQNRIRLALIAWASVSFAGRSLAVEDLVTPNPSNVVGYATCQKCHGQEIEVWKKTPHFETFRSLHRKPEAQEIAQRMGLRSIKRGDLCVKCHYTEQQQGSRVKAISGISCESCHGARGIGWPCTAITAVRARPRKWNPTLTSSSDEHRVWSWECGIRRTCI